MRRSCYKQESSAGISPALLNFTHSFPECKNISCIHSLRKSSNVSGRLRSSPKDFESLFTEGPSAGSVGDDQFGLFIEDMDLLGVESKGHALSGTNLGVRLDTGGNRVAVDIEIQEYFCAEQLVDVAGCVELVSSLFQSLGLRELRGPWPP